MSRSHPCRGSRRLSPAGPKPRPSRRSRAGAGPYAPRRRGAPGRATPTTAFSRTLQSQIRCLQPPQVALVYLRSLHELLHDADRCVLIWAVLKDRNASLDAPIASLGHGDDAGGICHRQVGQAIKRPERLSARRLLPACCESRRLGGSTRTPVAIGAAHFIGALSGYEVTCVTRS